MIHIDEQRLESDLGFRFQYMSEFMGFGTEDVAAIHAAATALAPLVPSLVDAVYDRLHRYDATWRHFLPRQHGYEGAVPKTLEEVTQDHEMIRFRKEHLARYLTILVTKPYDEKMVGYLDMVGKIHTLKAGAAELAVPLVQMNALLGFVADALTATIVSLGLERRQEVATLRAFCKLLWLQNDLINRHYQDGAALLALRERPQDRRRRHRSRDLQCMPAARTVTMAPTPNRYHNRMPIPPRLYRPTLAGLLTLLLAGPAAAFHHKETNGPATLAARSDHDRPALALADVLYVVVTLEGGKGLEVDAPVRLVAGAPWDVLATSATGPKTGEDGRVRWQQTLTLAPTAPGEQKIELSSLIFRDGDAEPRTIAWKPFTVPVETQIKNPDANAIRDITATEELPALPESSVPAWIYFAVLPALLIPALLGLWLILRRRPAPRSASALHKAMRESERLLAMKLPDKGQGKSFVALLTGIVRRYLERRFDLPARRQTTAELLRSIESRADLSDESKRRLRAFFEEADLVKYAGADVSAERCQALAQEMRQFCEATAQAGKAAKTFSINEIGELG